MYVDPNKVLVLDPDHSIEIGIPTWAKGKPPPPPGTPRSHSCRDRWVTANGGFSPHSSSEVPIDESLPHMVWHCANHDEFTLPDLLYMGKAILASVARRMTTSDLVHLPDLLSMGKAILSLVTRLVP